MKPFNTRGYAFTSMLKYVRVALPAARRHVVLARLSAETIAACEGARPNEFYPSRMLGEVLTAIAAAADGNADVARQDLIDGGKFMAEEAMSTFLRLVVRALTPGIFAKKLPSLYARDNTRGKAEVHVDERRLELRITDCEGFPNLGPVSAGWASFALETMGKKIASCTLHEWSLANQDPGSVWFEIEWQR